MRIAVLDDYLGVALEVADWSPIEDRCQITAFTQGLGPEAAVAAALAGFEGVVAMRERTPFPASLLEQLPRLRLLVTTGMRNQSIDVAAAQAQGVTVCGTRSSKASTGELTWALILGLARNLAVDDRAMRAGGWQSRPGIGLEGRTLGVLGLGAIGTRVASVGRALGMQVVAWSENLTDERAAEARVERVTKEELFRESDVLTIHLVLGERTRGLVGGFELALMKRSALVVNTSRAAIIDEASLLKALRSGALAGAALDVYEIEPLPDDHPFRSQDNLLLTPHMGYGTAENLGLMYRDAVEDIAAYLEGQPIRLLA